MKKVCVVFMLICMFGLMSSRAYASYIGASAEKAKQGIVNVFTGWLEVPYQVSKGWKSGFGEDENNKLLGGFLGVFRGLIHATGRTATGIYQVATFPLPNPKNNEGIGIPLDANQAWEEGTQYSLVNNGIQPIGKKAFRGFINTFFAIFEVPGQVAKGFEEDRPFIGLGKAVVFPIGRFSSGVYDLVTVLLPNSVEEYGYALEEKQPWDAIEEARRRNDQQ
ncbi:MAG: hypothetical protein ABH865_00410 [Candidatus Omnitrophota bacterium]